MRTGRIQTLLHMSPFTRLLATIVPLVALHHGSFAQKAGIGFKGGVQMSRTPTELLRTTWIPGASIGIYAPWGVGPKMELQPEVLIAAMGSGFVEPDEDRYTIRSIYLQVPLNFKLYVSNTLNFHAGVQASRLIQAERTLGEERFDHTERLNRMDYGFIGGLGLDLGRGVDLTLRYLNGMIPVLANDQVLFPRNQAISGTVGYRLKQIRVAGRSRRRR